MPQLNSPANSKDLSHEVNIGMLLESFLDGIEQQLEWHLMHVCPDCSTILTLTENLSRIRGGLADLKAKIDIGQYSDEQIRDALRDAGGLLVFFGPLPEKVTLSGCRLSV